MGAGSAPDTFDLHVAKRVGPRYNKEVQSYRSGEHKTLTRAENQISAYRERQQPALAA